MVMILLHSPQRMTPATQWFDTLSQCHQALADQTAHAMQADEDEAQLQELDIKGSAVLAVVSKRFMVWCEDGRLLAPDVLSELGKP
jgi:hypothetical protein